MFVQTERTAIKNMLFFLIFYIYTHKIYSVSAVLISAGALFRLNSVQTNMYYCSRHTS